VPRGSLTRAGDKSNAYVRQSKEGARHYRANNKLIEEHLIKKTKST